MTNLEKIKQMNIDELTSLLANQCSQCAIKLFGDYVINHPKYIKEWLECETKKEQA
jgi:hypothetical protein